MSSRPSNVLRIREMARVVRPGDRVLMTVYGNPQKIDFLGFLVGAIQSARPDFNGPPMDPPPLPFQLQDTDRLPRELTAAGLMGVKVETITETTEFHSGQDLWDWLIFSNPIVETVLGSLNLTNDERGQMQQALDHMVRERANAAATAKLTNPINIGVGNK